MQISRYIAKQISDEIKKVVPYKINIMDTQGIIIASSDRNRIGEVHMGARQLIENQLIELCIYDKDAFNGGQPGINLPVLIHNEIAGVIGISGNHEEIRPYAQLIKRMTEILLYQEILKDEQMQKNAQRDSFLYEWLYLQDYDDKMFERGMAIGFHIHVIRRFFAIKSKADLQDKEMQKMKSTIERIVVQDTDSFVLMMDSMFLIGMHACSDVRIKEYVEHLLRCLRDAGFTDVYVGIDRSDEKDALPYEQYTKAKRALTAGFGLHKQVMFYKDMCMELFIDEIHPTIREEFLHKIFKSYEYDELTKVIHVLTCYYQHNGSLLAASAQLYLHKNTLQNHLNKIKERTGYDPRSLQDAVYFQIAMKFYEYHHTSK